MKNRALWRILKQAGWLRIHGGKHDLAKNPGRPGEVITVPRHAEIAEFTARSILKEAGLKGEL